MTRQIAGTEQRRKKDEYGLGQEGRDRTAVVERAGLGAAIC